MPAIVCDLGSMKERVDHGLTDYVVNNEIEFSKKAIEVLTNDELHSVFSKNAQKKYADHTWNNVARMFTEI